MSAYIYIGFLVLMFLFGLVRAWSLYAVGVRSGKTLHNRMYNAVVRAPIRFHDTNPKGKLTNISTLTIEVAKLMLIHLNLGSVSTVNISMFSINNVVNCLT